MSIQHNLTINGQMPGQTNFVNGILESADYVACIDSEIGLMAISSSKPGTEPSPARMAMEILLDDMRTNLPQFEDANESKLSALGVNCLQESLDNINDYLYGRVGTVFHASTEVSTQLSVFQYLSGYLSYLLGAGIRGFILRNNHLNELSNTSSHSSGALGKRPEFESRAEQETLIPGDIIFIAASGDINTIGEEFIRITLSRFPQNLDTALRQINTRVSRKGTANIPVIILCRVNQEISAKRNWIGKLR